MQQNILGRNKARTADTLYNKNNRWFGGSTKGSSQSGNIKGNVIWERNRTGRDRKNLLSLYIDLIKHHIKKK